MKRHKAFREGRDNVRYIQRPNTCFDLGAFGEVLRMDEATIVKKYQKFIMMNSSVRGPFIPVWSKDCWSDIFTRRINDHTKVYIRLKNNSSTSSRYQAYQYSIVMFIANMILISFSPYLSFLAGGNDIQL